MTQKNVHRINDDEVSQVSLEDYSSSNDAPFFGSCSLIEIVCVWEMEI